MAQQPPEFEPVRLWRVFPWDPDAKPGAPFSVTAMPRHQGSGRFDIPHLTPVRYLAESPEHAVGERIQTLRGQRLANNNLEWQGRRLALVGMTIAAPTLDGLGIIDLCDPRALLEYDCRPDTLASRDRMRTQAIAARLYATTGAIGFRWWSAVVGDWHATILFANRVPPEVLRWDVQPEELSVVHPAVQSAAALLGMELDR